MGRKFGGRTPVASDRAILYRRLESYKGNKSNVEDVVEYLRSNYPDYRRIKLQPFTNRVAMTIEQQQRKIACQKPNVDEEDCDDIGTSSKFDRCHSPKRKKFKKNDPNEERLLRAENECIRRSRQECSSYSSSEEDGAVSTSEDAIFEMKFEPEFDLMKSMIRSSYTASKDPPPKTEEKNMEVEIVSKSKKVEPMRVMGSNKKILNRERRDDDIHGNSSGVIKGKEGPRFKDLGGMKNVLDELLLEVVFPLYHPQLPQLLGVRPMVGILLHGPPGCGKTKLAHAIANETGVPFYKISATEVVSGISGASEENIRDLFSKAYKTAPSIVFIDEIDAIASKRENLQREMERRIVTQLMTCMDEAYHNLGPTAGNSGSETSKKNPGYVIVIGATNRPDAVDAALRRPGRFDREIVLGVPDENARVEILSVLTHDLKLEGTFQLEKIARATPGFVGADLAALTNKAGNLAMKRIVDRRKFEISDESIGENGEEWWKQPWTPEEMESLAITMADFEEASKMVQPSSRREGFSSIPNVKWEDVGGLNSLREEFERYIVERIKHPEEYEEFGVDLETGFLLYGPPGCGKTLIAKAVANEAGANFIHIKGPELLNKYVGESELAVRTIFTRARTCAPCILFFDEVDALTTKRGNDGGWVVDRLLNQLLIELDGADQRQGVYVIGATNRPEVMDQAVLRPGRLGKLLYVPLPNADERASILKALASKKHIASDVDLGAIAQKERCENLSGADLASLMNEAAMAALDDKRRTKKEVGSTVEPFAIRKTHFDRALEKIMPSVSVREKEYYEAISRNLKAA